MGACPTLLCNVGMRRTGVDVHGKSRMLRNWASLIFPAPRRPLRVTVSVHQPWGSASSWDRRGSVTKAPYLACLLGKIYPTILSDVYLNSTTRMRNVSPATTQIRGKRLASLDNVQQDRILRPLHRQRSQSEENLVSEHLVRIPRQRVVEMALMPLQENQICSEHQETRVRHCLARIPRDRADDHQVGW